MIFEHFLWHKRNLNKYFEGEEVLSDVNCKIVWFYEVSMTRFKKMKKTGELEGVEGQHKSDSYILFFIHVKKYDFGYFEYCFAKLVLRVSFSYIVTSILRHHNIWS